MPVELPSDVPVRIQQHPCVVLAHSNAQRCVGCFAKFVFKLRWYTAPYRALSRSATKVTQVLTERDEARLRRISKALQPAREIGICSFEGVFCVVCSMLAYRVFVPLLWPACFVSTRFNMPRQGLARLLTQLVFAAQRLASSIPQRIRNLEALPGRRQSYTVRLRDSPCRGHGAVKQLPQRVRDSRKLPCSRAIEEERVAGSENKNYLRHRRIVCRPSRAVLVKALRKH